MPVIESGSLHRSVLHVIACRVISVSSTAVSLLVLVSVAVIAFPAAYLAFAPAPAFPSCNVVSTSNRAEEKIPPTPIYEKPLAWRFFRCRPTNCTIKYNVFRINQFVIDPNLVNRRRYVDIVRVVPFRNGEIVPLAKDHFLRMSVTIVRTNLGKGRVLPKGYFKYIRIHKILFISRDEQTESF